MSSFGFSITTVPSPSGCRAPRTVPAMSAVCFLPLSAPPRGLFVVLESQLFWQVLNLGLFTHSSSPDAGRAAGRMKKGVAILGEGRRGLCGGC